MEANNGKFQYWLVNERSLQSAELFSYLKMISLQYNVSKTMYIALNSLTFSKRAVWF